ncbi:DNA-packaging protein [Pseudomonas otitidis]|uniref:DNA-packaging protein n=1 Tax=Metapseudomonas otitidis TaxID=319939 RepID=UPI00244A635A|nr:DNA-packaging protein [Pseudomonas otitidis]MDH1105665.1 DNA-packaging protein [Pseudomonas otitidis]MDH1160096.1 DNA-packaging protein [Pseudomonas otitidis]MDH1164478.1 DNA-packaging protein [Pseudomonas otitidis]
MPPALRHALVVGAMVLVVAGLLAVLSAAYRAGYTTATAEGEAALEKQRAEHSQAEAERALQAAADAKAAATALREQTQRADQIAVRLADQQRQYRQTTDRLTGEIARVNDLYRAALDAPPVPLPDCRFTRGFVRVWDEATGAAVPTTAHADPGRTAQAAADAGAADQLDAGIGRADLLRHHIRYAEQCRATAAQLGALIDVLEDH